MAPAKGKKAETTNPFKAAELRKKQMQEEEERRRQQLLEEQQENGLPAAEPEKVGEEPAKQETPVQVAPVVETQPELQKEGIKPAEQPQKTQETVQATVPAAPEHTAAQPAEGFDVSAELRRLYASSEHLRFENEKKTHRYNALIKPSLNKKMERDMRNKNLKSKNDLINFLLEMYYGVE